MHNFKPWNKSIYTTVIKMSELIIRQRLPHHIVSLIFTYVIDCMGINKDLSQDIRHFVICKCKLQTKSCVLNASEILEDVFRLMRNLNMYEKYQRKMIYQEVEEDKWYPQVEDGVWNGEYDIEPGNLFVTKVSLKQYLCRSPSDGYEIVDDRPNRYSALFESIRDDYAIAHYRILHNVLCMVEPDDRAEIMSSCVNEGSRYRNYY